MQTVYGRKAWLVWAASIVVYIVAMMHRSSLGVAGLEAAEHFGTTAGIVSTFVVLQLTTYALAQLPAGALLDRYGSRAMLVVGTVAVGLGQVMLALVDDLPLAYAARVFLGLGDACIFNSVNQLGAATGIVITGGFVGGTVLILAMGVFLDVVSAGQPNTAEHMQWAWLLQVPLYAVGLTGIFVSRRRLRRKMAADGVVIPSWREVVERHRRS
jgi:MFS family permease